LLRISVTGQPDTGFGPGGLLTTEHIPHSPDSPPTAIAALPYSALIDDAVPAAPAGQSTGLDAAVVRIATEPPPSAPMAPTIIRNATAGNGKAMVSWNAPLHDNGSPVTGYVVTPYVGFYPLPSTTFGSTATTQTVTGLTNGTQYRFRVQAVNAIGTGAFSTVTNPVVPAPTAPTAPTIILNATAGTQQATVSWTAPSDDGGSPITGYVVTPYVGYIEHPSTTFSSTATTQTVTGLISGKTYRFRVRAINAVGTSGYSKVTNPVTPT
jgi:hypothetical protein